MCWGVIRRQIPMQRALVTLMLMVTLAAPALAQEPAVPDGDERPPQAMVRAERPSRPSRFSVEAGASLVSQYISRGVAFSEKPSLQPYVSLSVALPELTGGSISEFNWFVGNWNSLQSGGPGLGQANRGTLSGWYEADLYTGVSLGVRDRWKLALTYYYYHSPSHSFAGYSDVEAILSFDDSGHWEGVLPLSDFRLSPALRVTQEVNRPRRDDAFYIQPSLTPSFNIGREERPVRIRIPLVLGFSDDYYRGTRGGKVGFGYFRTGITIAGQPFAGSHIDGTLTVSGGFDFWMLNDKVANGLNDNEIVGRIGIRWNF